MARKRKAGDGTVRQRKDGRWEGRVVIGYDDNGYPKTKNVLAKTKKECVEKLQKLKEECGGLKPEKVRPEMPLGDWLTYWYENHSKPKIRPTTQETYESRIRLHIIPEIGDISLNKLTQNDLQQFYGRLKKSGRKRFTDKYGEGLSDRMVRMCHATCRSALEKAVQDGLIRVNPAIGCKLPPKKAREMQVLTREELQRFLIQAKFEGYYEVFLLDLATGLRRGELMALQWDDLNFKTGVLNVNKQVYDVRGQLQISTPKTKNSVRKIVLPPAVVAVLREYKKTVDSRWMFPSPVKEDCPITPGVVRRRLQLILEHAGCKHVRFHDLRHTFATLALENGMDVKTLSAMLGHVSAATTLDIYTHITDDMLADKGIDYREACRIFCNMLHSDSEVLLVAHNIQFDLLFILEMFKRCGMVPKAPKLRALDSLTVYKDRAASPHKLANAIEHYGLADKVQNSHRAIDDVLALYEVTKAMSEERDDLTDYIDLLGYNPKYGITGRKLRQITYMPQSYKLGCRLPDLMNGGGSCE